MTVRTRLALLFAVAFALGAAGTAGAYHTQFVERNCTWATPTIASHVTRDGAMQVALVARYEGYQWAGGCWDDDNRDDSPGDPKGIKETYGEGPDCSGYVFKSWRLSENKSDTRFHQWWRPRYIHGPYITQTFKAGDGAPNVIVSKTAAFKMDALASDSHMGMIYARNADGSDRILEAKGEDYGTNIWTRAYRGWAIYGGVRRTGWS
jgi:hypothetical protein